MARIRGDSRFATSRRESGKDRGMATVTVSSKYQIVIPSEVRKRVGLKPGQKLIVLEKGGIISLVPGAPLHRIHGRVRGLGSACPHLSTIKMTFRPR